MRRIKLLVTGDVETLCLHESLRRCFPERVRGKTVEWVRPSVVPGATTSRLTFGAPLASPMRAIGQALVEEVRVGSDPRGVAELVVGVDDLELANQHRGEVVADHLRRAVNEAIDRHAEPERARLRATLKERCSFHLLDPMVETYFFAGDQAALARAGVSGGVRPIVLRPDVEDFETDDPGWRPTCQAENATHAVVGRGWWRHERHAKHYLAHLVQRSGGLYSETTSGRAALGGLRWQDVPEGAETVPYARALFEDLANWFDVDSPLGPGSPAAATFPTRTARRDRLLLRNL